MNNKQIILLSTYCILACTAKADWGLDTNTWMTLAPFSDSQMTISNGSAFFLNRGILISQTNFPTSYEIDGSFEFTGSSYNQFQINLRTDGVLQQPANNFAIGTYVALGGGDNGINSPNPNVKVEDDIAGTVAETHFTFAMNTFYNFKIIDNSQKITLYLNNLAIPMLTLNTTNREGGTTNLIDIADSRGTDGGGVGGENVGVQLDNLDVREYVNLNIYSAIELGFLAQSNEVYQIQSSTNLINWNDFDTQIQGEGTNWFKLYSIRGQPKSFFRVEVIQ